MISMLDFLHNMFLSLTREQNLDILVQTQYRPIVQVPLTARSQWSIDYEAGFVRCLVEGERQICDLKHYYQFDGSGTK